MRWSGLSSEQHRVEQRKPFSQVIDQVSAGLSWAGAAHGESLGHLRLDADYLHQILDVSRKTCSGLPDQ